MRHRKTTPKLQRTPSHRDAMLRTMVTDFLRHERVRTTQAKAKALRRVAEKLITMGKKESVHARRNAGRIIRDKGVIKKLFDEIAPRYAERPGGYTRIIKLPIRSGDAAQMAIIELVEAEMERKPSRKKPKPKAGPRTAAQDTAAAAATAEPSSEHEVEAAPEEVAEAFADEAHATDEEKLDAPPGAQDPEGEPEAEDK